MLESLFGNITVEEILFFRNVYGESYPLGMAKTFGEPANRIQQQLKRLEGGGIVASRLVENVRQYTLDPRYPFLKELAGHCKGIHVPTRG